MKTKNNMYWNATIDNHIIDYKMATSKEERSKIYDEYIHAPLSTLVQCMLSKKYAQTYINVTGFESVQMETLSFAVDLMDKVDLTKGKGYSFITFCVDRWLKQKNMVECNSQSKHISIDDSVKNDDGDDDAGMVNILKELHYEDAYHLDNYRKFCDYLIQFLESKTDTIANDFSLGSSRQNCGAVLSAIISVLKGNEFDEFDEYPSRQSKYSLLKKYPHIAQIHSSKMPKYIERIKPYFRIARKAYSNGVDIQKLLAGARYYKL